MVEVFKTENDSILKEFSYKIAPNETTLDYMRQNNLCYRGIPCEMDMVLESGDKIIYYPIGEMILIDNKWSLFTRPNVDYYINEQ